MKAKYFYDRLLNYESESRKTQKYYYGFSNRMVTIHHIGDESTYYTIFDNKNVMVKKIGSYKTASMTLDDLSGDDYELFNIVQILKTGYIVLDTDSELEIKKVISKLSEHIEWDDEGYRRKGDNIPILCGESFWEDGVTDEFQYYATNEIEVHVQMVRNLCKSNINRKYYGLRCIPFIKSISNSQAIHVEFIQSMNKGNYNEEYEKCEEALKELKTMLNEITDSFRWVKCNIGKPCYC